MLKIGTATLTAAMFVVVGVVIAVKSIQVLIEHGPGLMEFLGL